jgi:hypothetical protein
MDGYATLEEAVHQAGLAAWTQNANRYEAMSIVYEHNGQFYFTPPKASGQRNNSDARATIKFPKGAKPRFVVHNHPEGEGAARFSQPDLETAEQHNLPSAIVFGRAAPQMRVYKPGASPTRFERSQRREYRVSDGEPFEWKPPAAGPTSQARPGPPRGFGLSPPEPQPGTMRPRGMRPNV